MIYLIFVQYMTHRMEILQECWECNLTTNSVKFIQQMTSSLSEADSGDANTNSQTLYSIHWCQLHQWLSAAANVTR